HRGTGGTRRARARGAARNGLRRRVARGARGAHDVVATSNETRERNVMTIEVKVPVLPESVSDATIATWHKKPGDAVKRDENLVDLETDKVVLEVPSPVDGVLKAIVKNTGDTVGSQEIIGILEAGAAAPVGATSFATPTPQA